MRAPLWHYRSNGPKRDVTQQRRQRIAELWEMGASVDRIAAELEMEERSIFRHLALLRISGQARSRKRLAAE